MIGTLKTFLERELNNSLDREKHRPSRRATPLTVPCSHVRLRPSASIDAPVVCTCGWEAFRSCEGCLCVPSRSRCRLCVRLRKAEAREPHLPHLPISSRRYASVSDGDAARRASARTPRVRMLGVKTRTRYLVQSRNARSQNCIKKSRDGLCLIASRGAPALLLLLTILLNDWY